MLVSYPALFHYEEGGYWVEFPDLYGCITEGDNLTHASKMAEEALGLYLDELEYDGQIIPQASDYKSVQSPEDGFVAIVSSDPSKYSRNEKSVKKTVTLPAWLNEEAKRANLNFSRILQEALKERVGQKW